MTGWITIPPYLLHIAHSDLHLFTKTQADSRQNKFNADEEVVAVVEQYFDNVDPDDYETGIMALQHSSPSVLVPNLNMLKKIVAVIQEFHVKFHLPSNYPRILSLFLNSSLSSRGKLKNAFRTIFSQSVVFVWYHFPSYGLALFVRTCIHEISCS